jgi:hypothetical protein
MRQADNPGANDRIVKRVDHARHAVKSVGHARHARG